MSQYRVKQIASTAYNGQTKYEYHFERKNLLMWEDIGFYRISKEKGMYVVGRMDLNTNANIEEDVKEYLLRYEQSKKYISGYTIIPVFVEDYATQLKYICVSKEDAKDHDVFNESEWYFFYFTETKPMDYEDAVKELKRLVGTQVMSTKTTYFLIDDDKKSILVK